MKLFAFVQTRMGSRRFPGKVLKEFDNGKRVFDLVIENLVKSEYLDRENIFILTSDDVSDNELADYATIHYLKVFRGDQFNVLKRFYDASKQFKSDYIIRVCGDNPFIQAKFIDELVSLGIKDKQADYITYKTSHNIPAILTHFGFFTELIEYNALTRAYKLARNPMDLEHVTRIFYTNPKRFSLLFKKIPNDLESKKMRFTIDTEQDFENINKILQNLSPKSGYEYPKLLAFVEKNPQLHQRMISSIKKNTK